MESSLESVLASLKAPYKTEELIEKIIPHLPIEYQKHFAVRFQAAANSKELDWILSNLKAGIDNKTIIIKE